MKNKNPAYGIIQAFQLFCFLIPAQTLRNQHLWDNKTQN